MSPRLLRSTPGAGAVRSYAGRLGRRRARACSACLAAKRSFCAASRTRSRRPACSERARLNAIAGRAAGRRVSREAAERTAIANLRQAAPLAEQAGVMLLVENINTVDMPGYFADTADRAAALVQAVDRPNVRLQLDQYHVGMMGDDPLPALR